MLGVANTWLMIRFGRRSLGEDPLAKLMPDPDDGSGTPGIGSAPSATAEPDSSHEDEDDLALVY